MSNKFENGSADTSEATFAKEQPPWCAKNICNILFSSLPDALEKMVEPFLLLLYFQLYHYSKTCY